jgi:hypothetical protein
MMMIVYGVWDGTKEHHSLFHGCHKIKGLTTLTPKMDFEKTAMDVTSSRLQYLS